MDTIKLYGTHGTSKWCAEQIEKNGFRIGKSGLRGKGTYFWYYDELNGESDAIDLGRNWVHTIAIKNPKHFDCDPSENKICAVISVEFLLEKKFLLDLNNPKLNMLLNKYLINAFMLIERIPNDWKGKEHKMKDRIGIINIAYNKFIKKWSSKSNISFKAVLVRVRAPDNNYYKERGDIEAFQQPLCINIMKSEGVTANILKIKYKGSID